VTASAHSQQLDLLGYRPAPAFDGWTFRRDFDQARLSSSLQRVFFALLDGEWHSLQELRRIAGSAADSRLRDLRKPKFGGFTIHSRRDPTDQCSGVWQYRLATGLLRHEQVQEVLGHAG
jgi:hypothetical protein